MTASIRRRRVLAVVVAFFALMGPGSAAAQDPPPTPTGPPAEAPQIIPRPNSGREPEFEGERGTASQYAVMALIVVGLMLIIVFVVLESKRKTSGRSPKPSDEVPQKT